MNGERKTRYLLFADILGTRELYSSHEKAELIEFKRSALGHAVRTAVFPYFDAKYKADIQINIFSDTVLVGCDNVLVLMRAAAHLFHIFSKYSFSADCVDRLYLLRGGISYGKVLSSNSIVTAKNVVVADIFDTSLELSYRLEGLRKGSRIFLCSRTYRTAARYPGLRFMKWKAITGIGAPIAPAFEYLWPATLFKTDLDFETSLLNLFRLWRRLFSEKPAWSIQEYDRTLYQLDETIKLFIRSAVHVPVKHLRKILDLLVSFLPSGDKSLAEFDIKYIWGIWFQVLRTILSLQKTHSRQVPGKETKQLVAVNLRFIDDLGYMATLLHELENPDYEPFKISLSETGLLKDQ